MGTIKDGNSKDLTEAKGIKKSWQECTELHKKGCNDNQITKMVNQHEWTDAEAEVPKLAT